MKKKTDNEATSEAARASEEQQPMDPAQDNVDATDAQGRLQDQLQRAMADLQNIRKRHVKELDLARQRALEGLAAELLPVLDNFQLALSAHEQHEVGSERSEAHAMIEGLNMVRSLLHGVLERHGLTEIPALGESFDPNVHEAVGVDESSDVDPGQVSKVMLRGYAMGDRVIRPAKVFVAGGGSSGTRDSGTRDPGDPDSGGPDSGDPDPGQAGRQED